MTANKKSPKTEAAGSLTMPRPRKDQRCNAQSPDVAKAVCQRAQGHAGEHSAGKVRWSA